MVVNRGVSEAGPVEEGVVECVESVGHVAEMLGLGGVTGHLGGQEAFREGQSLPDVCGEIVVDMIFGEGEDGVELELQFLEFLLQN